MVDTQALRFIMLLSLMIPLSGCICLHPDSDDVKVQCWPLYNSNRATVSHESGSKTTREHGDCLILIRWDNETGYDTKNELIEKKIHRMFIPFYDSRYTLTDTEKEGSGRILFFPYQFHKEIDHPWQ